MVPTKPFDTWTRYLVQEIDKQGVVGFLGGCLATFRGLLKVSFRKEESYGSLYASLEKHHAYHEKNRMSNKLG
jgi:hypothetical protein